MMGSAHPQASSIVTEDGLAELSPLEHKYEELVQSYERRSLALAAAAHELKTPLSVLAGYIDLLQSERIGRLTERERYALSEMEANCNRLMHVVNDFLTWASLEKGRLKLQLEIGDLTALIKDTVEIWRDRYVNKGVQLYFSAEDLGQVLVFFDQLKIAHVISNLLQNAYKFTPAGGKVSVHVGLNAWERRSMDTPVKENRRKENRLGSNSIKVTVSDTGPGISPEFQQEIFDDFAKGSGGSAEGTGLGLAIVRRIIQAHGGKVWVESRPAEGSKFSFVLPLSASAETRS